MQLFLRNKTIRICNPLSWGIEIHGWSLNDGIIIGLSAITSDNFHPLNMIGFSINGVNKPLIKSEGVVVRVGKLSDI